MLLKTAEAKGELTAKKEYGMVEKVQRGLENVGGVVKKMSWQEG